LFEGGPAEVAGEEVEKTDEACKAEARLGCIAVPDEQAQLS